MHASVRELKDARSGSSAGFNGALNRIRVAGCNNRWELSVQKSVHPSSRLGGSLLPLLLLPHCCYSKKPLEATDKLE